ncbi:GNAT family N-acetyltransferase [Lapidilactobacillus luobeiensis]|uniref:GNAT family N-acetyltransferase n=1 Tax=Lapidilactobacillus luobeiensis TaxID=2950371 RepID=UPI0021C44D42|nr:GNAT family N-acetyltransferase [Lapidilactobacillus luobeiensis]
MVEVTLKRVQETELGTVWQMQQQFFATPTQDQMRFVDSLAQIHWRFRNEQNNYFFILFGDQRAGYLRLQRDKTGQRGQLSPLVLLSDFQQCGIASQVLTLIEMTAPEIRVWQVRLQLTTSLAPILAKQGYQQVDDGYWRKIKD